MSEYRIEVGMQSGRVFTSTTYEDEAAVVNDSAAIFEGDKAGNSYVTQIDLTVVALRTPLIEWVRVFKAGAEADDQAVKALGDTIRDAAAVRAVEAAARV